MFFNLAGGDAQELMGPLYSTLLAISAGAVFMGAKTYIGNAPNFMVQVDLRGARRQDAELLRLHAVVGRDPLAALRGVHLDLVHVGPAYSLRPSSRLMFSLMKVGAQSPLALKL